MPSIAVELNHSVGLLYIAIRAVLGRAHSLNAASSLASSGQSRQGLRTS
jgi:hypothetical protein